MTRIAVSGIMYVESVWIRTKQTGRNMDKKNWIILAVVVLIAAAMFAVAPMLNLHADENLVLITVDGMEYARVPLSQPQTVTVRQRNGETNVIEITEDGAVMASSTCHNQLCVQMGEVTLDNWELRANQTFIICLPNRVTVELVVKE